MKRKVNFVEGEFYHLYNRGNSKQAIFLDDKDRDRFVKLLYLCNSNKSFNFREDIVEKKIDVWDFDRGDQIVSIGAWVLMPNHFHVFTTPKPGLGVVGNGVTIFIHKLLTSYSKYFNKKYDRTGGLFESRFKSAHADSDEYLKYLFSYMHLNPVKLIDPNWKELGVKNVANISAFLDSYKWSSYLDFKDVERAEGKILSRKDFPEYFNTTEVFLEEIIDWLNFDPQQVTPKPGLGVV